MAFQPINFASIRPQGNPFFRDLVDNLVKGYQAGQLPQQMARQQQKEELANALSKLTLEEEPERFKTEQEGKSLINALQKLKVQEEPQRFGSEMSTASLGRALDQARINQLRQEAALPFGGKVAPGSVGQAMWVNMIKDRYGENSAQYQMAKEAYESDIEKAKVLNTYRDVLTTTAGKRASTQLGKAAQELSDVEAGYKPGTNRAETLSPLEQADLRDKYHLQMQKQVSDLDSRKRSLFASNIDKTLDQINVEHLTQYAGLKGGLSKLAEEGKAPLGKESQNYRNYQKSLSAAELLAKQIRQFYGDSIQPAMQARIEEMVNPASWLNNPTLAKQNFNTVKNILEKETSTYRGALKSTREFEGQPKGNRLKFNPSTGGFE